MPLNRPFGALDGSAHLTQFAIVQTEKLAEAIEDYELANIPLPELLLAAIDSLSSQLQNFGPADDIPLFLDSGLGPQAIIDNNLEVAWHLSACVYFHNRINNSFINDVSFAVNTILMCLLRTEELKTLVEPDLMYRDEPATFPAFVASCNAVDRRPWMYWWRWVQQYDLLNVNATWMTIKVIWQIMDETQVDGEPDLSWVEILQGPAAVPMHLSTVFEAFGFY